MDFNYYYYDHGDVQDYLVNLLRHYGFRAGKEKWISGVRELMLQGPALILKCAGINP